jgi:uncharacterized protein (DUF1778 family)
VELTAVVMYVHEAYDRMMSSKSERLNLRLTSEQDAVLRRAAQAKGESLSDYVLRHAVDAASSDLADRRLFVLDDRQWRALRKRLDAPERPARRLRTLLSEPSVLDNN